MATGTGSTDDITILVGSHTLGKELKIKESIQIMERNRKKSNFP
jgi:hypothetical protein